VIIYRSNQWDPSAQNAPVLPLFTHIVLDEVHVGPKPLPETELAALQLLLYMVHINSAVNYTRVCIESFHCNVDYHWVVRWFGHIYRMDSNRIARQVTDWTLPHFRRKRGRPRVSWTSTVKKDLDLLGLTWDEALGLAWDEALALTKDRSEWRDCTALCASTARRRTKV